MTSEEQARVERYVKVKRESACGMHQRWRQSDHNIASAADAANPAAMTPGYRIESGSAFPQTPVHCRYSG